MAEIDTQRLDGSEVPQEPGSIVNDIILHGTAAPEESAAFGSTEVAANEEEVRAPGHRVEHRGRKPSVYPSHRIDMSSIRFSPKSNRTLLDLENLHRNGLADRRMRQLTSRNRAKDFES